MLRMGPSEAAIMRLAPSRAKNTSKLPALQSKWQKDLRPLVCDL